MHQSAFTFLKFFFFSSRRLHTRCGRDWSSNVCSSDLTAETKNAVESLAAYGMHVRYESGYTAVPGKKETDTVLAEQAVTAALKAAADHIPILFFEIGRASCRERV